MNALLFRLAFALAAPFWALMILAPRWRWTRRIAASPLIVLAPLSIWPVAIGSDFGPFATEMLNPDLDGVRALFASPGVVTAVWAHLIAFDLFIGRWMYLDARDRGLHPLVVSPILFLTIFLSPIGLTLYLAVRTLRRPPPGSTPALSGPAQHPR
ncbi:ABA4-like family protein [Catenuloplanes sp. NPDC051500]|uniref:ABA4-like family protein n=1 Tax=Catenuloplanes sp. NPDC051500 TaxID=3363959 RepID=UPI0037B0BF15